MCGIAGYVGTRMLQPAAVDRCLSLLERRGPDDAGSMVVDVSADRRAWFINRRLRIVDLDPRAAQPMQRNGFCLTYNGEVYNYRELRDILARAGSAFTTTCDTEVLLAGLMAHGVGFLERAEGMWAFAMFDPRARSVTLARDRFGEKPLYLYRDSSGLYFASEVKCLFELVGRRLPINRRQVQRYLADGYRSLYKGSETFFEGVTEVAPGTWLTIQADGSERAGAYWTPAIAPDAAMPYTDAVRGARSRLERSVEHRLRADVSVAFCLSGGVDSTALAAIARNVCGYDVHAFTVVDRDPRYDERMLARSVAGALDIRQTEIHLDPSGFLQGLRQLVRYHDAPILTISYLVHWQLMQQVAAAGYRVSVSGTGADELFSGYYDHHLWYMHDVAADAAALVEARSAWERIIRPIVRNPLLRDPAPFLADATFRGYLETDRGQLAAFLVDPASEAFGERAYTDTGVLRNRMLNELLHEAVPVILHEDDLNSMYYSVENRSPYLDRDLFDWCGRIPTPHLIRCGLAKAVLRDAVRDLLPAAVVDNARKIGFNASVKTLLDTSSRDVRAEVLAESPIFDYVRRDAIVGLLDQEQLADSSGKFLFSFLSAKIFLEEFAG
jgi:asparagine synthase (glutamine-hydrolysing)